MLVAQVETADVLVLNKCDLLTPAQLTSLQQLLTQLNPHSTQVTSLYGRVPLSLVLGTGLRQKSAAAARYAVGVAIG